jgi:starch phosphorylase
MKVADYLKLGLHLRADGSFSLSMTILAMRLSRLRNGVSRLHGEVSRKMWAHLWPDLEPYEAPITSVTNGVHTGTWAAPEFQDLFSRYIGESWECQLDEPEAWKGLRRASPKELYETKQRLKADMIEFIRSREEERLERLGVSQRRRKEQTKDLLDPNVLTIGFARRFAPYKRAPLLFHDAKRALRIFSSKSRPLQIIFAGKPHPQDAAGTLLFEKIAAWSRKKGFRGRVVLLENYDVEVCRHLVAGVDVWLNNPRRPQEASGTSGQKVPINGGLNFSILDGWWCEGYSSQTGWAFGNPVDYRDTKTQDAEDARDLYRVLERDVLPLYYRRNRRGVPVDWFRKVRASMALLIPRFSTSHMVLEYARRLYAPAMASGKSLLSSKARNAKKLAKWKATVMRHWPLVQIRGWRGRGSSTLVDLYLPGIDPKCLCFQDAKGLEHEVKVVKTLAPDQYRLQIRGLHPSSLRNPHKNAGFYPTHDLLGDPRELGIRLAMVL